MPKNNPWDKFTYRLVDANGQPVVGADGKPVTECITTGRAEIRNTQLADGRRWRRETAEEMRSRR